MLSRRDVLQAGIAGALALPLGSARGASVAVPRWPPYRDALAIDGEGGFNLLYAEDDAALRKDLQAVRASGLSAALYSITPGGPWFREGAYAAINERIGTCTARIAAHADRLLLVERAADLQCARRERRFGVILRFQNSAPIADDLGRIAAFRRMGIRVVQLTHNVRNLVGDGFMEQGNAGLSGYGRGVVEELNAQKMLVDLSHASQRTMAEAIAASKAPVLISHTGCRALADLPRNAGDAELRAMADKGGVAGILFWPYLTTRGQPMAADVVRHIEHAVKVCGEDHVGIGTDGDIAPVERTPAFEQENRAIARDVVEGGYVGTGPRPENLYLFVPDLNTADRFKTLAGMLSARGHSDARIGKLLGGNFARVMGEVWG